MKYYHLLALLLITGCNSGGSSHSVENGANENNNLPIAEQLSLSAYQRIYYGANNQQFYDLRLPADAETAQTPLPIIVLIHGGCWVKATANYSYFNPIAEDLTNRGYVTINAEYRALGDIGGGWPGTFEDIGTIIDSVEILADSLPIDTQRVVVAGHSAGGHLAIWAGLRDQIEMGQTLFNINPLIPALTVGLAAITDLQQYSGTGCGSGINRLIGAQPRSEEFKQRLTVTSPFHMNISTTASLMIQGERDRIVPASQASNYVTKLQKNNVKATLLLQPSTDHFSMLNIDSFAWQQTVETIELALKP